MINRFFVGLLRRPYIWNKFNNPINLVCKKQKFLVVWFLSLKNQLKLKKNVKPSIFFIHFSFLPNFILMDQCYFYDQTY